MEPSASFISHSKGYLWGYQWKNVPGWHCLTLQFLSEICSSRCIGSENQCHRKLAGPELEIWRDTESDLIQRDTVRLPTLIDPVGESFEALFKLAHFFKWSFPSSNFSFGLGRVSELMFSSLSELLEGYSSFLLLPLLEELVAFDFFFLFSSRNVSNITVWELLDTSWAWIRMNSTF